VADAPSKAICYATPPLTHHPDGRERRVGIELEFAGLDTRAVLNAIQETLGGVIVEASPTRGEVRETPHGDFHVELDSTLLKERSYAEALKRIGLDVDNDPTLAKAEELVLRAARELVPMEVASPPIPISKLAELDVLWSRLRALGAQGTHAAWRYAFGLHFNPEVADETADGVLSHLKAFLLLEAWLVQQGRTDATRRIAPYIKPFPKEYRSLVLSTDYWPAWPSLIADYLSFNPTRDRPLDLLPLFAHVDPRAVEGRVENAHLIKPRPTFHYRLPNSDVDREGWSPAAEWNRWLLVEKLAVDRPELTELSRRFIQSRAGVSLTDPWPGEIQQWVERKAASGEAQAVSTPGQGRTEACRGQAATSR
jgi:hypothetical protein